MAMQWGDELKGLSDDDDEFERKLGIEASTDNAKDSADKQPKFEGKDENEDTAEATTTDTIG